MDLVGAVIRQSSFNRKMHNIDWLHSLAPESTMQRLISRYENYVAIMARYPGKTVVPTLDIDLAWHTHQTAPQSYQAYCLQKTSIFIDHDDKIDENTLSTAFEWTSKTYQEMFSRVYSECTCWYCEAVRESHLPQNKSKPLHRLFKHSNPSPQDLLSQSLAALYTAAPAPADQANHISAHSTTRAAYEDPETYLAAVVRARQLDRAYEIACQRAQKDRRPAPRRDEVFEAWGHRIPAKEGWAPFMGDPYISGGLYVADPACAGGAQGSCALGTAAGDVGNAHVALAPCGSDGYGGCGTGEFESGGLGILGVGSCGGGAAGGGGG